MTNKTLSPLNAAMGLSIGLYSNGIISALVALTWYRLVLTFAAGLCVLKAGNPLNNYRVKSSGCLYSFSGVMTRRICNGLVCPDNERMSLFRLPPSWTRHNSLATHIVINCSANGAACPPHNFRPYFIAKRHHCRQTLDDNGVIFRSPGRDDRSPCWR